jgi:hypothetical protein
MPLIWFNFWIHISPTAWGNLNTLLTLTATH